MGGSMDPGLGVPPADAWFLVLVGPGPGSTLAVPAGHWEIGRLPELALSLSDPSVSRHHAVVDRSGSRVRIHDQGSRNGTFLNGKRVHDVAELREGDVVRVGSVVLRFVSGIGAAATDQTSAQSHDASHPPQPRIGSVQGAVQTGAGTQYYAGRDQYNAGGDQYLDHSVHVQNDYEPTDEIWEGRGLGRVLLIIGLCAVIVGFLLWMYNIFSLGSDVASGPDQSTPQFFGPEAIVGGLLFIGGAILAGVGGGMSKAARKRAERLERDAGRRAHGNWRDDGAR